MEIFLQNLIDEDFGYEKGGGIWGRASKHNSLVLNEKTQQWFWNSRGLRGNLLDYLILVRNYTKDSAEKFVKNSIAIYENSGNIEDTITPPYDRLVELMWNSGKNNREYWYKRCLTDETIDKFRLGFFDGWNLIPMYNEGVFCNFQCRREFPDKRIKQWYKNGKPVLFNSDILQFIDVAYMTEGTVDAILLTQHGLPAVSQNGTNIWMNEWFSKFSKIKKIVYIEDNDKAGRVASKLISKSLGYDRVKILCYEGQDEKFDTVDFFRCGNNINDLKDLIETKAKYIYELEDIDVKRYSARA